MVYAPYEIEPLAWDSCFFGYKVGRVLLPHDLEMQKVVAQEVIYAAKKASYKLVYAFCSHGSVPLNLDFMEGLGYRSVGGKREYQKDLLILTEAGSSDFSSIAECHQLSEPLLGLAFQSGLLSRFKSDPGFVHNEFERLYSEWLSQSVCGNGNISTFIFGKRRAPRGFVTVERDGNEFRIGLFAVDKNCRRSGVGRNLEMYVEKWGAEHGCERLHVATQQENKTACSFYEKCGFQIVSETLIFHLWV